MERLKQEPPENMEEAHYDIDEGGGTNGISVHGQQGNLNPYLKVEQIETIPDTLGLIEMRRGNRSFSFAEKKDILTAYDNLPPKTTQTEASRLLDIPQTTLRRIVKQRSHIMAGTTENLAGRKRLRLGHHPDVDSAVIKWISICHQQQVKPTAIQIMDKANEFAAKLDSQSFRANPSWLRRLKAREGVLNEIFNHKLKEVNHSQITDDDIVFEVKEKFESGGKLIPGVLKSYKEEGNGCTTDDSQSFAELTFEEEIEEEDVNLPSFEDMQKAMALLKTGLLSRGYKKHNLLNNFEASVHSFIHDTDLF